MGKATAAKLILFGEYSVLAGGKLLAIPSEQFYGELYYMHDEERKQMFYAFHEYLTSQEFVKQHIDLEKFKIDIENGLNFKTNFKTGYGLGSSGVLVAILYKEYGSKQLGTNLALLELFGLMESFFHDKSSGFDPLISYLDQAVLKQQSGIELLKNRPISVPYHLYLLDSKQGRSTQKQVAMHIDQLKGDHQYFERNQKIAEITNEIIRGLINTQSPSLDSEMAELSKLQYEQFGPETPENIKVAWKKSLDNEQYFMKLCGAGGGGYFQLYSKQPITANSWEKLSLSKFR